MINEIETNQYLINLENKINKKGKITRTKLRTFRLFFYLYIVYLVNKGR